ncbi:MAG: transposase [Planctomycetota bacterium]
MAELELKENARLLWWKTGCTGCQLFHTFEDYQTGSWPHTRRVISKVEFTRNGGLNPSPSGRFVITNITGFAKDIYHGCYTQRGRMGEGDASSNLVSHVASHWSGRDLLNMAIKSLSDHIEALRQSWQHQNLFVCAEELFRRQCASPAPAKISFAPLPLKSPLAATSTGSVSGRCLPWHCARMVEFCAKPASLYRCNCSPVLPGRSFFSDAP